MPASQRRRSKVGIRTIIHVAAGTVLWIVAARYLSRGFLELVPYIAPAAIAGLTIGWVSHVFAQRQFRWATGLESAIAGGFYLTPLIAGFVVLTGTFGAEIIVFVLTFGSWALIVFALAIGALVYAGRVVVSPRARRRTAARARHAYRRIRRRRRGPTTPARQGSIEPAAMTLPGRPEGTTERDVGEWRNRVD